MTRNSAKGDPRKDKHSPASSGGSSSAKRARRNDDTDTDTSCDEKDTVVPSGFLMLTTDHWRAVFPFLSFDDIKELTASSRSFLIDPSRFDYGDDFVLQVRNDRNQISKRLNSKEFKGLSSDLFAPLSRFQGTRTVQILGGNTGDNQLASDLIPVKKSLLRQLLLGLGSNVVTDLTVCGLSANRNSDPPPQLSPAFIDAFEPVKGSLEALHIDVGPYVKPRQLFPSVALLSGLVHLKLALSKWMYLNQVDKLTFEKSFESLASLSNLKDLALVHKDRYYESMSWNRNLLIANNAGREVTESHTELVPILLRRCSQMKGLRFLWSDFLGPSRYEPLFVEMDVSLEHLEELAVVTLDNTSHLWEKLAARECFLNLKRITVSYSDAYRHQVESFVQYAPNHLPSLSSVHIILEYHHNPFRWNDPSGGEAVEVLAELRHHNALANIEVLICGHAAEQVGNGTLNPSGLARDLNNQIGEGITVELGRSLRQMRSDYEWSWRSF